MACITKKWRGRTSDTVRFKSPSNATWPSMSLALCQLCFSVSGIFCQYRTILVLGLYYCMSISTENKSIILPSRRPRISSDWHWCWQNHWRIPELINSLGIQCSNWAGSILCPLLKQEWGKPYPTPSEKSWGVSQDKQ